MYKITEGLATEGIGETGYPQRFSDNITGVYTDLTADTWRILDVRFMLDEPQDLAVYKGAILLAGMLKDMHPNRLLICCGAGQSRSNAIALGYLVAYEARNFFDAYNLIMEKVPICNIEPCHIEALKQIFGVTLP